MADEHDAELMTTDEPEPADAGDEEPVPDDLLELFEAIEAFGPGPVE